MKIPFLIAFVALISVISFTDANALSQNDCIALTNLSTTELGYTVMTCDNPFNVIVNMGQRLHIQNPTGGSHNMLPSASYGSSGTYQFSSANTGVIGTSGTIILQNPPNIGVSLQNIQVSFSGSQMSVSGNIINSNNFPVKNLYVYWHVTDNSGNYLTSWTRYGNDGQAYSSQIPAQSTDTFSETVCCLPSSGASTATPYIVQAFKDDGTKLISINNPPIITANSPSDNPNSTIEGNNLELKIMVTGTVQNKISGKDSISVTFTDPKGTAVYQKSLTLNSQGNFNNEFENPLYIKDMRDSGLYHAKFVYDTITKEFDWNYLTSVYKSPILDTIPPVIVVPNNMAIQATSNNPSPVTFSVSATDDKDGIVTPTCSPKSGSNFAIGKTTVTCTATDKVGNIATKSFTVTVTKVTSIDTDGDGILDSSDSCPTQPETLNGYQDIDGCPDSTQSISPNLQFDKLNYKSSDIAKITVTGNPSDKISLLIIDPNDTQKIFSDGSSEIHITLQQDGRKTYSLSLKGYPSGVYTAVVSKDAITISGSSQIFTVGLQTGSGEIEIKCTKSEYVAGEPILVLGNADSNSLLTLTLIDPSGNILKTKETFSDKKGKMIDDTFRIPADAKSGIWQIKAQSGSNFDITKFTVDDGQSISKQVEKKLAEEKKISEKKLYDAKKASDAKKAMADKKTAEKKALDAKKALEDKKAEKIKIAKEKAKKIAEAKKAKK